MARQLELKKGLSSNKRDGPKLQNKKLELGWLFKDGQGQTESGMRQHVFVYTACVRVCVCGRVIQSTISVP